MNKTKYYVWERNDGYIASTPYMPHNWNSPNGEVTFKLLKVFDEWNSTVVNFIDQACNDKLTEKKNAN